MNVGELQLLIERLATVSLQRWAFVVSSLVAVVGASTCTASASGQQSGVVLALIVGFGVLAVIRPDSHTALAVETIVVWQWLATVDDLTTPWAIPMALSLLVFHTLIALMAVTPISAVVDRVVVARWLWRCGAVATATVAMWLVVVLVDGRNADGNAALTAAAFATAAALVVALRANRSSAPNR
jgi:hypothetical protein